MCFVGKVLAELSLTNVFAEKKRWLGNSSGSTLKIIDTVILENVPAAILTIMNKVY